jgi:hypothetical protein
VRILVVFAMEIESRKKRRRRFKQALPLAERLLRSAYAARAAAERLPPGLDQMRLLKRAREAEAIVQLDEFLRSPARYPPRGS